MASLAARAAASSASGLERARVVGLARARSRLLWEEEGGGRGGGRVGKKREEVEG